METTMFGWAKNVGAQVSMLKEKKQPFPWVNSSMRLHFPSVQKLEAGYAACAG